MILALPTNRSGLLITVFFLLFCVGETYFPNPAWPNKEISIKMLEAGSKIQTHGGTPVGKGIFVKAEFTNRGNKTINHCLVSISFYDQKNNLVNLPLSAKEKPDPDYFRAITTEQGVYRITSFSDGLKPGVSQKTEYHIKLPVKYDTSVIRSISLKVIGYGGDRYGFELLGGLLAPISEREKLSVTISKLKSRRVRYLGQGDKWRFSSDSSVKLLSKSARVFQETGWSLKARVSKAKSTTAILSINNFGGGALDYFIHGQGIGRKCSLDPGRECEIQLKPGLYSFSFVIPGSAPTTWIKALSAGKRYSLSPIPNRKASIKHTKGKPSKIKKAGRAFSLRVAQKIIAANRADPRVANLAGITNVQGFKIDSTRRDIILFGEANPSLSPILFQDLVVAIRSAWNRYPTEKNGEKYRTFPGCSIDPDPNVMSQLNAITSSRSQTGKDRWKDVCASPQKVRVMGMPFNSHFGKVLVQADYDMKRLVNGSDDPGIPGFKSLAEIIKAEIKRDISAGEDPKLLGTLMNRFWFFPGELHSARDNGAYVIDKCPVTLLTEEEFLSKGKITGKGRGNPLATRFADGLTRQYNRIAAKRPIFQQMEQLFRLYYLAQLLRFDGAVWKARCLASEPVGQGQVFS